MWSLLSSVHSVPCSLSAAKNAAPVDAADGRRGGGGVGGGRRHVHQCSLPVRRPEARREPVKKIIAGSPMFSCVLEHVHRHGDGKDTEIHITLRSWTVD